MKKREIDWNVVDIWIGMLLLTIGSVAGLYFLMDGGLIALATAPIVLVLIYMIYGRDKLDIYYFEKVRHEARQEAILKRMQKKSNREHVKYAYTKDTLPIKTRRRRRRRLH